jgi:hypothetical protein
MDGNHMNAQKMEGDRSRSEPASGMKHDQLDRRLIILSRIFFAFNLLLALIGTVLRLPSIGVIDSGLISGFEFNLLTDVIVTFDSVLATGVVGLLILSKYPRNVVG